MPVEVVILLVVLLTAILAVYSIQRRAKRKLPPKHRDADLVRVVLGLEEKTLDDLFQLYGREFGAGAARYARRTYNKWKSGEVRPNRQTFNRLLIRLPEVMSFDLKCEVLRKLRQEYCSRDDYRLTVKTRDWKGALAPLVREIIRKSYTAELPSTVAGRLSWLAANDMQVARDILARSQALESANAIRLLEREFESIEQLMGDAGGRSEITHTLKLPLGTITLKIEGR